MSTSGADSLLRFGVVAALAAAGALLSGPPAAADRGVSIDVGRVEITDGLLPGGGYRLPAFGVRNPGDEPAAYRMLISTSGGRTAKQPPAAWFRFQPSSFTLRPGATRRVVARIELPTDARPGDYEALVGAQLVNDGTGAQVGAGAAARVSFTVEPTSALSAAWLQVRELVGGTAPWSWLVPVALVALAFLAALRRRFSISISRRG